MIELFYGGCVFYHYHSRGKIMNGKGDNSIQHFIVAKKHLGIGLTVALMFGERVAGSSTVGNAASAFKMGLSSVWTNWGMVLGVLVFVFCTAKFYRRAGHFGVMSVPEAFAFRFDKRVRLVVLVIIMFVYGIIFSQQPIAAAALLSSMLGVNKAVLAWIVGNFICLYGSSWFKRHCRNECDPFSCDVCRNVCSQLPCCRKSRRSGIYDCKYTGSLFYRYLSG